METVTVNLNDYLELKKRAEQIVEYGKSPEKFSFKITSMDFCNYYEILTNDSVLKNIYKENDELKAKLAEYEKQSAKNIKRKYILF